jgi:hypothetical protein
MNDLQVNVTEANVKDSPTARETIPVSRIPARCSLTTLDYEVRQRLCCFKQNARFLRRIFGFTILMTFAIILCQGFHVVGFHLSETFLHWLGAATVGEVAGLFAMVLRKT